MATDKVISIRLSSDELDRLQKMADKAGLTRHKLITNLITAGLETIEDLDKVGIIRASMMVRNGYDFLRSMGKGKATEAEEPDSAEGRENLE